MERYRDIDNDSGVTGYEFDEGSITIFFRNGGVYRYDSSRPGGAHVEEMKRLAQLGDGLNRYINKFVRKGYVAKIR